jgi:hypothetical protein
MICVEQPIANPNNSKQTSKDGAELPTVNKLLLTSAQQTCAKDQEVILPTHKKKSTPRPPSCHHSVLTLDRDVPLFFDMEANTSINIYAIIRSSKETIPIQKLKTITTDLLSDIEDPRYVKLLVSFHLPPEDDAHNLEKNDFEVTMLRSWNLDYEFWHSQPVHREEFCPHGFWKKLHNNK